MILGIAGSRDIELPLPDELMPKNIDKIVSGGAEGIDKSARNYALNHKIPILEILPEYDLYGKLAPLKRNDIIINQSDIVYIFWNGKSHGSEYVIRKCRKLSKPHKVFLLKDNKYSILKQVP